VSNSADGPLRLTAEEMEEFGSWLFIDLASRPGQRGRPQKNPMQGVFSKLSFGKSPGMQQRGMLRGSDFSRRLALWVHGWRGTGMTMRRACEKAAEVDLVKARLGRPTRGRKPNIPGDGEQEADETIRTCYDAVRKKWGLDQMLRAYYGWFLDWKQWVIDANEKALKFVAGLYPKTGPVNAKSFLRFVYKIREKSS
jgi:hypothetical protein